LVANVLMNLGYVSYHKVGLVFGIGSDEHTDVLEAFAKRIAELSQGKTKGIRLA